MVEAAITFTESLVTIACGKCGIWFAVPARFDRERREHTDLDFYCPNGHSRVYVESEATKLHKELERERQKTEMARRERDQAEARAASEARMTARLRKRIRNGVCPCCGRSFQNVQRHMTTKHPNYGQLTKGKP